MCSRCGSRDYAASPRGGQPPLDPKSDEPSAQTEATARFKQDATAQSALATTVALSKVRADDFDAVFYPVDTALCGLSRDKHSINLIESAYAAESRLHWYATLPECCAM